MDRPAGTIGSTGYRLIKLFDRSYRIHRLIWLMQTGHWPTKQIDHKNLDKTDNRWKNLRLANNAQSQQNTKMQARNRTGFKGVHKQTTKSGRYYALIGINGKNKYLGTFDTPLAAHLAYQKGAQKYFGEFARFK